MECTQLVSFEWLQERLAGDGQTGLVVLDVSWSSTKDMEQHYNQGHIPSAVYFNVMDGDHTDMFPRNLPQQDNFQQKAQKAGINPDSHVVIYSDSDACGYFLSGRAWWTFKCFGHTNVSILDGGFAKWKASGGPVSTDTPEVQAGSFKANVSTDIRRKFDEMEELISETTQICDSRPVEKYNGIVSSIGHIKSAKNIPMSTLVDQEKGTLRSVEELKQAFSSVGVDIDKPVVTYCNSGMSSCTLAFAAKLCGGQNVSVYHGGFTEWSKRASPDYIEK